MDNNDNLITGTIEPEPDVTMREARTRLGITQADLSYMLGVPLRTIENWDSGLRKCPVYVDRLVKLHMAPYPQPSPDNSDFNVGCALAFICQDAGVLPNIEAIHTLKVKPLDFIQNIIEKYLPTGLRDETRHFITKYLNNIPAEYGDIPAEKCNLGYVLYGLSSARHFIDHSGMYRGTRLNRMYPQ